MDRSLLMDKIILDTNNLPEGYISRPATMDDLEAIVEAINAATREKIGSDKFTVSDYKVDWELPAYNLETDTRLVISPQGQVAGIYEFWDVNEPHVRYMVWGRIHPEHEGKGIGSYMLAWADRRADESLNRAPDGARVYLQAFVPSIFEEADILLRDNGYRFVRHALRMVINLDGAPPAPQWPQGISVRVAQVDQELPDVLHAVRDSFKDHWGHIETPFEQDYERWVHFTRNDEKFDPALWFVAMDGKEIAGVSLCWKSAFDDPEMGWVGTLGVRRPWRRRGLGLALLHHSFAEFQRRGKARVGLGVDAESLTGATRLYTKAGMQPDPRHQHSLYEKELRPGIELGTQSLD